MRKVIVDWRRRVVLRSKGRACAARRSSQSEPAAVRAKQTTTCFTIISFHIWILWNYFILKCLFHFEHHMCACNGNVLFQKILWSCMTRSCSLHDQLLPSYWRSLMICIDANMSARLFDAFKVQSHKVYIKPIVMENPMLGQQPTYCKESKQPMLF